MVKIFRQMNLKFEAKIDPYRTYSFGELGFPNPKNNLGLTIYKHVIDIKIGSA